MTNLQARKQKCSFPRRHRPLLAAAVLAAVLVPTGFAAAQSGSSSSVDREDCENAWDDSQASQHCPASTNQFEMTVTSDEQCKVTTTCTDSDGASSAMHTFTGSLQDIRDLESCDGSLEIGCIAAAQAAAQQAPLPDQCKDAWDESGASQHCGSSYGDHSVTVSNKQCQVSTSCGTPATTVSYFGSVNEMKQLNYCDSTLYAGTCEAFALAQLTSTCNDAWSDSSASGSCGTSANAGWHNVSGVAPASDGQCEVTTWCYGPPNQYGIRTVHFNEYFKGTPAQMKTLKNCDGTLKAGSC